MGLEDSLYGAIQKTRASFSSDNSKWADYLSKYDLKQYFSDDVPEEQKVRFRSVLENKLNAKTEKYNKELQGLGRKVVSKGTMALAVLNDLYAYVSNVPIINVTGLGYALFAIKTLAEIPSLYHYAKKSGDWYGALTHTILKPIRYLIPVLGPALESGAFDRMVRKRIMKETAAEFIKEFGKYKGVEKIAQENLGKKIGDLVYSPTHMPA